MLIIHQTNKFDLIAKTSYAPDYVKQKKIFIYQGVVSE